MTSLDPSDWYSAAEQRHAHLPPGEERDRRVKRTFEQIREESEIVALKLPDLTEDERQAIEAEAIWSTLMARGCPATEDELARFYHHTDMLLEILEVQARFAKAPGRVQRKLEERRWSRMSGVRRYVGLPTL